MEARPGTDRGASYDPTTSSSPPEKASVVEDFIDIFHSPASVFARRENSSFWVHLLIISVIAGLFAFASRSVFEQVFEADFQRRIAAAATDPRITPEMLESQRNISVKIGGFTMYLYMPLAVFFAGFFAWVAARIVGAKISYGQAAMILTLAFIPRLVASLITTLQVVMTDTASITTIFQLTLSPARFLNQETTSRMVLGLLSRFDVFVLWSTVLIAIGIAVMGKIPRSKAAIAAGIVWLIPTIFALFS